MASDLPISDFPSLLGFIPQHIACSMNNITPGRDIEVQTEDQ